nr:Gag-Pol polyprotein [Tanacetum cinerariifolium]
MKDRVMLNNSQEKRQEVEDHHRNVKFSKNKTSVTACYDSLNSKILNVTFVCATCGKCVLNEKHDMSVLKSRNNVNSRTKMPMVVPVSSRQPKRIVKQSVAKPIRKIVISESTNQKPRNTTKKLYKHISKTFSWWYPKFTPPGYNWKPKSKIGNVNQKPKLKSNSMKDRVMLNNSQEKRQEVEDHHRNVKFSKNKTSVTACYDSLNSKILNVTFVCATCGKCVLNEKHDMSVLKSRNNVNSRTKMPMVVPVSSRQPKRIVKQSVAKPIRKIVISESTNQKPRNTTKKLYKHISKTFSWWYPKFTPPGYNWKPKSKIGNLVEIILFIVDSGCLKHMMRNLKLLSNFMEKFLGTVKFGNDQIAPYLGYGDLNGLVKDHLCSSCELGKAKRKSFQPKATPSSKRRLQLLDIDLCGPMRVESINGKKYLLVIVDNYSRYTWTHFLRSKDETPEVLIDFL